MPTPAYTNLDSNKPSGSDSPTTYATDNLNNIRALRDMVITGRAAGFVQSRTQGTGPDVSRPQYITWLNSSLQIGFRMKSTWGGTGNCQQTSVEWEWTNDNGSSWATLGTAQANTFDSSDNITATTNSGGLVALLMEIWTKLLRLTGAIKIDAATGRVGLGTSSPGKNLDIEIGSAGGGARIISTGSGGGSVAAFEGIGYRSDINGTFFTRFAGAYRRSDGTAIASGAGLGALLFGGQHGTDTTYQSAKVLYAASIIGIAEGSFTASNAMATGISFRTGSSGEDAYAVNTSYGTERLRITSDGRLYGSALHNNAGAVTGTTNQYIASGTMAAGNATAVTNVAGTPTYQTLTWMRVGNVVTVAGSVTAQATTENTVCAIRIPLPIASSFTAIEDCAGTGVWATGDNGVPVRIRADEINDQAAIRWVPISTVNTVMPIHFTYLIK